MRVRLGKQDGGRNGDHRIAIIGEANEEIGFVEFGVRERVIDVRWVEVAVQHRRRGLGVEAVRLLEAEAAERWGVRGVRAHVPVDVGLALYFWLRLGYRPEEPVAGEGDTMAMVRELEQGTGNTEQEGTQALRPT